MKRISFVIITAILAIAFVCGCAGAPAQSGEDDVEKVGGMILNA